VREPRRRFIAGVASVLAAPLAARAQTATGKTARIGYLSFRGGPSSLEEAFRQGLRELGYFEGQNIAIEFRWANFKADRVSALAAELVGLKVDVIVTTGGPVPATAAKRATATIPIVFTTGNPVGAGLVTSLNRPGGNVTGLNVLSPRGSTMPSRPWPESGPTLLSPRPRRCSGSRCRPHCSCEPIT